MQQLDIRRLTGPNVLWSKPGAILDVSCTVEEAEQLVPLWQKQAHRVLRAVGWRHEKTVVHPFLGGISFAFSAPVDALYAATEVIEHLWSLCSNGLTHGIAPGDDKEEIARLKTLIAEERNPALLKLMDAANDHNLTLLSDDDEVSIGLGRGSHTWSVNDLPHPDDVDWNQLEEIPVAIVTGTNGKTTTVRLASHILQAAGLNAGISSTDWIGVNDRIIERGDFSGPGGARSVLRQPNVDIAVLETARGGMLRRGLALQHAEVVVITNVAEDHLGDYGSRTLAELLDLKWVVTQALDKYGTLILNADDPSLVAKAQGYEGKITWFSLHEANPTVTNHIAAGGKALVIQDQQLTILDSGYSCALCRVNELPLALGGGARHNIANALSAAALTLALGIGTETIAQGLLSMQSSDNPGRSNLFDINGVQVLLDFAHNPEAMAAVFTLARSLPARRRLLAFGQAGDRTDESIQQLAGAAWEIGLDRVLISELPKYYRGREPGEVYAILRDKLLAEGAKSEQIEHHSLETDALKSALSHAERGDLIIMLGLENSTSLLDELKFRQAAQP